MDRQREQKKLMVSACLLGACCRYDGENNAQPELKELKLAAELVPFCPEVYGGLSTPRQPSEISGRRVFTKDGRDVTEQFEKGAFEALKMAKLLGCSAAILKERSPSCGSHQVYDGTFTGRKKKGMGVTAALLAENGIRLFSESELDACLHWVKETEEERKDV